MGTNEIKNNVLNLKNIVQNKSVKKFLKENNLLNQLSNKSLFMVTNDGIKIDLDGDGKYDKQINCVFDNNGAISKCNAISDIQPESQKTQNVAQMLNNLYSNLGFSFSSAEETPINGEVVSDILPQKNEEQSSFIHTSTTPSIVANNEKQTETGFGFTNNAQPPTASMEKLQQSILNLNLSGVKVEIVENFKPTKS